MPAVVINDIDARWQKKLAVIKIRNYSRETDFVCGFFFSKNFIKPSNTENLLEALNTVPVSPLFVFFFYLFYVILEVNDPIMRNRYIRYFDITTFKSRWTFFHDLTEIQKNSIVTQ